MKRERLMTPAGLDRTPGWRLAALIRPSGYYNIKAKRLKNLAGFIRDRYSGSLRRMFSSGPGELRKGLLQVNGIGPRRPTPFSCTLRTCPLLSSMPTRSAFSAGTGLSRLMRITTLSRKRSWTAFRPMSGCIMNSMP
ncbi:MAG: hypothetical protein ACM32I_10910 [Nitrospirota bacterium]